MTRFGLRARLAIAATVMIVSSFNLATGRADDRPPGSCETSPDSWVRACLLSNNLVAEGLIDSVNRVDVYPFEVLELGGTPTASLQVAPPGYRIRMLDWRGRTISESIVTSTDSTAETHATLRLPGIYYVAVDVPTEQAFVADGPYRVAVETPLGSASPRVLLSGIRPRSPLAESDDSVPRGSWAYQITTARGGTPSSGIAAARLLSLPDRQSVDDFVLVADARLDGADGQAAITVRFRYKPEAGGGAGYVFSLDPVMAQIRLAAFDEGKQTALIPWTPLAVAVSPSERIRVVLQVVGDTITAYVDGEQVLRIEHAGPRSGLVALGAVTWSGPVTATFEQILLVAVS